MRNFAAVIFDMDGLLLDTERLALETFRATCLRFDLGDLSKLFFQCMGTSSKLGKSILKSGLDGIVDFDKFCLDWEGRYVRVTEAQPIPLKDGVRQLLGQIEATHTPMAVATSAHTDRAMANLGSCGLLNYFNVIIGGDQVKRSKPDPEIYLKAASALSSAPSQILALEDSTNGVKAAFAAGMTVVQIPDLVQPSEELLKLGHKVLNSLAEVPKSIVFS